MGMLAVGRVLRRGVNEGTKTWLDAGYARDVHCDLFRCGYNDRWLNFIRVTHLALCVSDPVEPEWGRSISRETEGYHSRVTM